MKLRQTRVCVSVLASIPILTSIQEAAGLQESARAFQIAPGPFTPTWDSLQQYRCPDWFRDAKFGIWAHWSAQCQPEAGDWYARGMYQEGSEQYKYHLAHYGHPSKFGFKDVCNIWHAERWDPNKLIQLYKRAGAKYFVALANHHCNFDMWNSKYQTWNSVNIGPKKDIVGTWAAAARKAGMKFGVTVHSARSWDWFQVAHGSDKAGPMAGVPYDGRLTKADGKGQWWERFDPQELYCRAHDPKESPDAAYVSKWFNRTKDLVDSANPDLLYFDDSRLPLGNAGLSIAAHYYNNNMRTHNGKLQAVLTTKDMPEELRRTVVWDIERGRSDKIEPFPWQTDTCIGDWHYKRGIRYKTAAQVIPMLIDIVSKNGNLLLNIPIKGDGTIDGEELKFLEEMAKWMAVNSEGVFGSRPWVISSEGPARERGGSFNEGQDRKYTARDFRFTMKGETLYAFVLGWPEDGRLRIRSLARTPGSTSSIRDVRLLGSNGKVAWSQDEKSLAMRLPAGKPCDHAFSLKITGTNLRRFKPTMSDGPETHVVGPDTSGNIVLQPGLADLHGTKIQVENRAGTDNIGFWDSPNEWVAWTLKLTIPAAYQITAFSAAASGPSELEVEIDGRKITVQVPATTGWDDFVTITVGRHVLTPGSHVLSVKPLDAKTWKPINLREVRFTKPN